MQEYIVGLNKDVDYDAFWNEIQTTTNGLTYIPDRAVSVANERKGSQRLTHYTLSESEAELLKNDPRVYCVEIPPSKRNDISIGVMAVQSSNFTKNASNSSNDSNWGLVRSLSKNNNYGSSPSINDKYIYTLDGKGVDIVIQDSGIQSDHPEFSGRVQDIDWYTASGISGTQNSNHNRDFFGHGTHVAGIAAGKHFGWGKRANIYSQKIRGLEGSGDENTGIPVEDAFDCIRLWHASKNGNKPTVVNMSWGYYSQITPNSINYRGSNYTSDWENYGVIENNDNYRIPVRVDSVDIEIQEMIDAGIHIVTSAGNDYTKIDIPGGNDYNNYVSSSLGNAFFYHRGGSPYDDEAISVGNLYSASYDENTDQKALSSNCGPGVDLYAPGTKILSAVSTVYGMTSYSTGSYFDDNNYKQMTLSGTSMAAPQVTGFLSLLLQINPTASPQEVKKSLLNNCGSALYSTNQDNDFTNHISIKGSEKRILFNKFGQVENPAEFNLPINANIFVK